MSKMSDLIEILHGSLGELYGYLCMSDRDGETTIPEEAKDRAEKALRRVDAWKRGDTLDTPGERTK